MIVIEAENYSGMGMILVALHLGTTVVFTEKMSVRTSTSSSAHPLSSQPGMLPGPTAF